MWQKDRKNYHLILNSNAVVLEGELIEMACGIQRHPNKSRQVVITPTWEHCPICDGIWHIVFTSVADARDRVKTTTNVKVLSRALELASQVTLRKMIEARIRKLQKGGA